MSIERFKRLDQIKAAAAAEFGLPIDNERVTTISGLRLHREVLLETLAAGGTIEGNALANVSKLIVELSPEPPIPPVKLEILATCGECMKSFPISELPPEPGDGDRLPRTIDLPAGDPHLPHPAASVKPVAYDPQTDAHRLKQPVKNYTPPKPPEQKPDYEPAHDFGKTETCIKNPIGVGTNPFLGGFAQTSNEFSFPSDPGRKPPSGGV
jgi:hypothetical protein